MVFTEGKFLCPQHKDGSDAGREHPLFEKGVRRQVW